MRYCNSAPEVIVKTPYTKKRKFKKRLFIALFIILSFIIATVVYFESNVNPIIISASSAKIDALANKATAEAISEICAGNAYSDFVSTVYNNEGDIQIIQANTPKITATSHEISLKVYQKLKTLGNQGIDIALGTLSGLPVFSEKGPKINFEFLPIGAARCEISSDFSSAGINQTLHKIYATVYCDITVIVPGFRNRKVSVCATAMLAESIIIGKVPNVYLKGGIINSSLNLVP